MFTFQRKPPWPHAQLSTGAAAPVHTSARQTEESVHWGHRCSPWNSIRTYPAGPFGDVEFSQKRSNAPSAELGEDTLVNPPGSPFPLRRHSCPQRVSAGPFACTQQVLDAQVWGTRAQPERGHPAVSPTRSQGAGAVWWYQNSNRATARTNGCLQLPRQHLPALSHFLSTALHSSQCTQQAFKKMY